jgi:pilus assembly protein CpaE
LLGVVISTYTIKPNVSARTALAMAIIGPNFLVRSELSRAIAGFQSGHISEFSSFPGNFEEMTNLLSNGYDILIIELDSEPGPALSLIENALEHCSSAVVVYSVQNNPEMMVQCMRAGVREFLQLPCSSESIEEALARVVSRGSSAGMESMETGKPNGGLFVFLSAKGGAGVTTLACNFAVCLASESAKNSLLIDLNLPLGDAAINLGVKSSYSTIDALQNSSRLDCKLLETLLVRHSSGLAVLASPTDIQPEQVSNDAFDKLLTVARKAFDYVVVDAGLRQDVLRSVSIGECSTIYLVTQVGIPELRNANRFITQCAQSGGPKLEIVINRYEKNLEISDDSINKALTRPPQWRIPNNFRAVRQMQKTGTPLVFEDTAIGGSIREMARAVTGKTVEVSKRKGFRLFGN